MFQIKEWLGVEKLLSLDAYKDYYGMDTSTASSMSTIKSAAT